MLRSIFSRFRMTNQQGLPKYADLSKEELVQRIQELESQLASKPSKGLQRYEKNKPKKKFNFSKYPTRFIALRFSYLGWQYNGLAIQKTPTPSPTIEGIIIEALQKCRLVQSGNPSDFKFSRCGRTDKGVSALNQVISLRVRSNLTEEEQSDPANDEKEIDYISVLNHLFPDDIKIHSICLRPPKGFDARFSCKSRHYKYLFHSQGLDIAKMQKGALEYLGEHDFRNFCKLDGSKQIVNYNRKVMRSSIIPVSKIDEVTGEGFYCFDLEGSAFLWHQVRNMIGVLFLIGQGLESPAIIQDLLNVEKYRTRPNYEMGSDLPLILYDCKFGDDIEWLQPRESSRRDQTNRIAYSNWVENTIKAQVSAYMMQLFPDQEKDRLRINLGDGRGKVVAEYVPLEKRDRMDSFESVNERYRKKQKR